LAALRRLGLAAFSALSFAFVGPLRRYRPVAGARVAAATVEAARREAPGAHVFDAEGIEALAAGKEA
jgi:hypothetical protein